MSSRILGRGILWRYPLCEGHCFGGCEDIMTATWRPASSPTVTSGRQSDATEDAQHLAGDGGADAALTTPEGGVRGRQAVPIR